MAKELDFDAIKAAAESHRADMTRFLRAMISHPSESCEEGEVVACIKAEMEALGYDEVKVDGLGNVMGFMGEGDKIIAIDSHIDTVGIGNIENWDFDPYKGFEDDQLIGLDKTSSVLCFSTEGDTDPDQYRRIVWEGEYPTC